MSGDRNADHLAILELNAAFAEAVDHDESVDGAVELFTDDGIWHMAGRPHTGSSEIRAALQGTRAGGFAGPLAGTRHVVSSHRVKVADDGATATGSSQWLLVQTATPPEQPALRAIGRYVDEYRKVDGRWRVARRDVLP